jgi:hypothetical protein
MYPRFELYKYEVGMYSSLQMALDALQQHSHTEQYNNKSSNRNKYKDITYSYHIAEYLLDFQTSCDPLTRRIYDKDANLIDECLLSEYFNDELKLSCNFRGRPKPKIRFKSGDFVECQWFDHEEVALGIIQATVWSTEDYDSRCSDVGELRMDHTDDCYTVLWCFEGSALQVINGKKVMVERKLEKYKDGDDPDFHGHVQSIYLSKPRFPISETLKNTIIAAYHANCIEAGFEDNLFT